MFEKYGVGKNRRLTQAEAITLLQEEFDLTFKYATLFFQHIDADQNGHLSLWEFSHFYKNVGHR